MSAVGSRSFRSSTPFRVIPSACGRPLRTFLFLFNDKGLLDERDIYIFLAESKYALVEWWCQGGKSSKSHKFDQECQKLNPDQILELLERGYPWDPEHFEILEITNKPILVPPIRTIRAELNEYLIPDLTNIIIDFMQISEYDLEGSESDCPMEWENAMESDD